MIPQLSQGVRLQCPNLVPRQEKALSTSAIVIVVPVKRRDISLGPLVRQQSLFANLHKETALLRSAPYIPGPPSPEDSRPRGEQPLQAIPPGHAGTADKSGAQVDCKGNAMPLEQGKPLGQVVPIPVIQSEDKGTGGPGPLSRQGGVQLGDGKESETLVPGIDDKAFQEGGGNLHVLVGRQPRRILFSYPVQHDAKNAVPQKTAQDAGCRRT